mgnify:CR=1 FL=1
MEQLIMRWERARHTGTVRDSIAAILGRIPAEITLRTFGGSANDPSYTALCLDASRNNLHYEGLEITELEDFDPMALTRFTFIDGETHHVTLVCENEIVVMYVDGVKALSSRITHSINGAHIGVFADGCSASFRNITIKTPG